MLQPGRISRAAQARFAARCNVLTESSTNLVFYNLLMEGTERPNQSCDSFDTKEHIWFAYFENLNL